MQLPFNYLTEITKKFFQVSFSQCYENSYVGEFECLQSLMKTLQISNGYIVDIGASDGYEMHPTFGFYRQGWQGLSLEMESDKFAKLAFLYQHFPRVNLARFKAVPESVTQLLGAYQVPSDFDLLNLDIDSYDLSVLRAILVNYRPKTIIMEINEMIPPPVYFEVLYDPGIKWNVDRFFGCSLTAAVTTLMPNGYILCDLVYNNAIFVRSDVASGKLDNQNPRDAYFKGYAGKSDIDAKFCYNKDIKYLFAAEPDEIVAYYRNIFRKYEGQYILTVDQ